MAAHAGRAQQLLFAFLLQLGWQPTTSGTGPTVELWFWGYGDDREQPSSGQDGSAPLSCTVGKVLGCYNDSAWDDKPTPGRRALQHPVQLPAGVALSREACAVACCAGGYGADPARPADVPVAGVEFGADCFCDRPFTPELAHSTPAANTSECAAKPCADGEPCGEPRAGLRVDLRVHLPARPAAGETVILLHPPSPFSRCFNRGEEDGYQHNDSPADG